MKISAGTDVGKVRDNNQDYYLLGNLPDGVWAVVCDGMGGHAGGNVASKIASEKIKYMITSNYRNDMSVSSVRNMLETAIASANIDVFDMAEQTPNLKGMGTTVVAAVIRPSGSVVAHVGDSRCYHISDGEIRQITKDHSMVQELLDTGAITKEEALVHPRRNIITRALGLFEYEKIDFTEPILKAGDKLLICSDGLTNHVSDDEILNLVTTRPMNSIAEELIDLANKNGGSDNITVVLLEC